MKFRLIIILFFLNCCTNYEKNSTKILYNSKGFAYIYNENDYLENIINKKFDNSKELIGHNKLNTGTLVMLTNPVKNKSIILKNSTKVNYPDFYKILLTEKVARKLDLNMNAPYIDIQVVKKNKSFIAQKAETHQEEKNVKTKAPVELVKIDNIQKKVEKKLKKTNKFIIIIGDFYSIKTAKILKNELANKLINLESNKLNISTNKKNSIRLFSGPYSSLNLLKNDYIELKKYGFEDLDVKIYE